MKNDSQNRRLACFSPLVMLLTFSFEFLAAAFIAWRYKLNRRAVLIIAMLINLGLFQIAEWQVCANSGAQLWARIGFIGTALLIPLGLGVVQNMDRTRLTRAATLLAWITAGSFIAWFIFVPNSVHFVFCGGNYSIYRLAPGLEVAYAFFYWGWLLVTMILALCSARRAADSRIKRALVWFAIGYATFVGPTLISNAAAPQTLRAIPSILCGFAIIFAIILVTIVAPASLQPRKR